MLAVILLKNINTLWLGVYTRYTPWYMLDIRTPVKPFEVRLQWDRNMHNRTTRK